MIRAKKWIRSHPYNKEQAFVSNLHDLASLVHVYNHVNISIMIYYYYYLQHLYSANFMH